MYKKILVALDNSPADEQLLAHVVKLASCLGSELLLLHVAEGFVARHFSDFQLSESEEMTTSRSYLEARAHDIAAQGIATNTLLAMGDPSQEILNAAKAQQCDLIAMGSHGHRLLGDIVYGSAVHFVRHKSTLPILIVCPNRNE